MLRIVFWTLVTQGSDIEMISEEKQALKAMADKHLSDINLFEVFTPPEEFERQVGMVVLRHLDCAFTSTRSHLLSRYNDEMLDCAKQDLVEPFVGGMFLAFLAQTARDIRQMCEDDERTHVLVVSTAETLEPIIHSYRINTHLAFGDLVRFDLDVKDSEVRIREVTHLSASFISVS